jgi:hypothetical protein
MRFSLMTLLLAFVVVWSALATFGVAGLVFAGVLLFVAARLRMWGEIGKTTPGFLFWDVLVPACLILCLVALIKPPVSSGEYTRRRQCQHNLSQIAIGLHNYHDAFGCFPPAHVLGPDGKPWHSWRVLILPFLDEEKLYEQYDFSQPWDGPNNRELADNKPERYLCYADPSFATSPTTNYVAVVGPKAAWAGSEPRSPDEFRDGADSTILLVEVAGSGIHWMEPRDLSLHEARTGVHPPGPGRISSHHTTEYGGFWREEHLANVALGDGRVLLLREWGHQPTLEAALTVDGNEEIDPDALLQGPSKLDWSRVFAPIVLLVSYLILLLRPRKRREVEPQGASPCDSA